MKIIQGNLLHQQGILVHQTNCIGVMGGGIALQIAELYPHVKREYQKFVKSRHDSELGLLGEVQFITVGKSYIVNLFGQYAFGPGKCHTSYVAHEKAWPTIAKKSKELGLPVFLPYLLGCGLGGGNWAKLLPIIESSCPDATIVEYTG